MMVITPFKDMLSAPVTVHICCANDLGQLCVDLNAVIECCSPPQRLDCHSWRQEVITIKPLKQYRMIRRHSRKNLEPISVHRVVFSYSILRS